MLLVQSPGPQWRRRFHVLTLHDGGAGIGLVGLVRGPDADDSAELGVMLLSGWQGRGLTREGPLAFIGWAFDTLGLERLCGAWQLTNQRSVGLTKRPDSELASGSHDGLQ